MKAFKAIMWKEYMQIKQRRKAIMVNSASTAVFVCFLGAIRLLGFKSSGTDTPENITNVVLYVAIMCTYMALLSLIRFWQEKSNKTIEMLLAVPMNVVPVITAKLVVPVVIACIIGCIDTIVMSIVTVILYQSLQINLFYVIGIQLMFGILIGIPYSFINAYSMWCMDITYSKLVQGISTFAYGGIPIVMFTSKNNDLLLLPKMILLCFVILSLIAGYMLLRIDKEKIVIRFLE